MLIEVMGPGCPRCYEVERRAWAALKELGLEGDSEIVHVNDPRAIALRRVVLTPALAVDGVVKLSGRVPTVEEIKQLLGAAPAPPPGG